MAIRPSVHRPMMNKVKGILFCRTLLAPSPLSNDHSDVQSDDLRVSCFFVAFSPRVLQACLGHRRCISSYWTREGLLSNPPVFLVARRRTTQRRLGSRDKPLNGTMRQRSYAFCSASCASLAAIQFRLLFFVIPMRVYFKRGGTPRSNEISGKMRNVGLLKYTLFPTQRHAWS